MKQVTIDEVPRQVLEAAEQVEEYFANRGVLCWALGGLQSRVKTDSPREAQVVDATAGDMLRALMAKDDPPEGMPRVINATLMQMGFVCLGGRLLRLQLPNGRTLRVTLE